MEYEINTPAELVRKLCELLGVNQSELAEITDISEQTFSNWTGERTKYFDTNSINKIGRAMSKKNWGIQVDAKSRSKVIIYKTDPTPANMLRDNKVDYGVDPQGNKIISFFLTHIERLEKELDDLKLENRSLKEKLQKYGTS